LDIHLKVKLNSYKFFVQLT